MRMIMIGGIYNGEERVGFRILDADSISNGHGQIMDVPEDKVYYALSSNKIENLEIKGKRLKGSNGDISRYAHIVDGKMQESNSPLVIITQIGDAGYIVSDCFGQIRRMRTNELIKLLNTYKIANGKLMTRDGTQYISTISGKYYYIPYKEESPKKVEVIQPKTNIQSDKQTKAEDITEEQVEQSEDKKYYTFSMNPEQLSALKQCYLYLSVNGDIANAEIVEMDNAVKNNKLDKIYLRTPLLNEMIAKMGTGFRLVNAFGTDLATVIARLIVVGIPLPKSLVIRCCETIQQGDNVIVLYTNVLNEFEDTINSIFKAKTDTLRVSACEYMRYMAYREILGEYKGITTQDDEDAINLAKNYGMVTDRTLTGIRSIVGTINLLDEFSYELRDQLNEHYYLKKHIDKMHYAALDYVKKSVGIERQLALTILHITTFTPELGDKKYDTPLWNESGYISVRRFLDQPIDKKHPECDFNSTPTYRKHINNVYRDLLNLLRSDSKEEFTKFMRFAYDYALVKENIQKEEDRKALDEIARKSLERQQELKRQTSRSSTFKVPNDETSNVQKENTDGQHSAILQTASTDTSKEDCTIIPDTKTKTVGTPESQKIDNTGKTQLQIDLESGTDISKYDPIDVYNELKKHTSISMTDICFTISEDMISRNLQYRDMTNRQRYRLNEAINKMMQDVYGRQKKESKDTKSENKTLVNNKYQLSEHPDITSRVNRLLAKANDVEMTAVLAKEPNVLKICYSILRYQTASDKQLARVDNALKILDEQ